MTSSLRFGRPIIKATVRASEICIQGHRRDRFHFGSRDDPLPTIQATIEGETTLIETIPEIIAKKIYYRGSSIKPRDIFDIAAASEDHADSVIEALKIYRNEVKGTLATIDKLNPDFVSTAIAQLSIRDEFRTVAKTALEQTKELLRSV